MIAVTRADVRYRAADVFWRILAYSGVFWRILAYADEAAAWASCRCFCRTLNAVLAGSCPSNLKNFQEYLSITLSKLTLK